MRKIAIGYGLRVPSNAPNILEGRESMRVAAEGLDARRRARVDVDLILVRVERELLVVRLEIEEAELLQIIGLGIHVEADARVSIADRGRLHEIRDGAVRAVGAGELVDADRTRVLVE